MCAVRATLERRYGRLQVPMDPSAGAGQVQDRAEHVARMLARFGPRLHQFTPAERRRGYRQQRAYYRWRAKPKPKPIPAPEPDPTR